MAIAKTNTILSNGYNLAAALKTFDPSWETEAIDKTALATGDREFELGFESAEINAEGFWESDRTNLNKIHDILSAALDSRATQRLTAFLQDYAFGGDCFMLDGSIMNYAPPMQVNAVILANAKWRSNNGMCVGKGYISQASAATTITSSSIDNGAASTRGGLLHAHLDNNAATSVAVKMQHSTDDSTWVDLVSITTMTGANYDSGSASVAVGTTIRRYTRAVAVISGGAVDLLSVAFARR
jgi:hypothetical protein